MGYFNYFIRCIIRRFVRLFFTKKTFIVILIFISLFVLLKSEGYCSQDVLMSSVFCNFYINSSLGYISTLPILSLNIMSVSGYRVLQFLPGHSYRFEVDGSSMVSGLRFDSMNFTSYSSNSNDNLVNQDSDLAYQRYYPQNYVSGYVYYFSFETYFAFSNDLMNSVRCYEIVDDVKSSDITSQTNTIVDTSQSTQNTIKDTSQQMQNTIKDSNVVLDTDLPTNDTEDITSSGFDSIFTIIYNAFCTTQSQPLVVNLPFIDTPMEIKPDLLSSALKKDSRLNALLLFIQSFWWFKISYSIFKDINRYIERLKSGNITSDDGNIKTEVL